MFHEGEPGDRGFKIKMKYSWLNKGDEEDYEGEKDDMKWLKDLYDIHSRKKERNTNC